MNSCKNIKNSLTFYVSTYLQDRYIPGVHLADMMFVTHENTYSDLHDNCHNRIMEEDPGMVNLVEVKVKGCHSSLRNRIWKKLGTLGVWKHQTVWSVSVKVKG